MARIVFFGKLSDSAGTRELNLTLPDDLKNVADLITHLARDNAILEEALGHISVRVAINEEFSHHQAIITDSDEIAFLPPVSGG